MVPCIGTVLDGPSLLLGIVLDMRKRLTTIERIVRRRQVLGLSYSELGRLLGIRPGHWWKIEKSQVRLLAELVPRIAAALRTSVSALYGEPRSASTTRAPKTPRAWRLRLTGSHREPKTPSAMSCANG
jgi:DNA-binding XRE family transcriptional regulator